MNRRSFLASLGGIVAGLAGLSTAAQGSHDCTNWTNRPLDRDTTDLVGKLRETDAKVRQRNQMTFRGTPIVWDPDLSSNHAYTLHDTGHGLAALRILS